MLVLSGKDISKSYGTDIITEDVSFGVNKGDRIGIVGANGTGKTTLLGIIAGETEASSGSIFIRNDCTLGYLRQKNIFFAGGTVKSEAEKTFEHLFSMEKEIERLQLSLADHENPDFNRDLARYTALMEEYEKQGGYTYKSELSAVLRHMGFSETDQNKQISMLSGGERTRLALACMLLRRPDILMLDEPTNHLDLRMLSWLESFLRSYQGTLLVVSHDRFFLDRIATRIFDMSGGTLTAYEGNYSEFLVKKEQRLEIMQREYEKQQAEIARQQEMITRFKQHGTEHLAKRARSREKRLSHIQRIEKPHQEQTKMKLSFDLSYKSGGEVLIAEDLAKSYGSRQLFRDVSLSVRKGEKVCIIGDNGIGKTTLLRILMGLETPDTGYLKTGYNVDFGYYDQGQQLLNENETVIGEMKDAYHLYTDTEMRSLLGRFLFKGDDVFKMVRDIAGGDKATPALLKQMLSGANPLILDEPTNPLEIESKEVVEEALTEFEGTLIIVLHDRYMLTRLPDRILELTEDGIVEYKGNFEYYLEKNEQTDAESGQSQSGSDAVTGGSAKTGGSGRNGSRNGSGRGGKSETDRTLELVRSSEADRQAKKKQEAEDRRRSRRSDDLENRIFELESAISELQEEISDPEKAQDFEWMQQQATQLAEYEEQIAALYDEWMELQ
ncbi:MAG: ABC-F family ATP-binding cassette domain-containing protein [Mogibacterium sp.]|nr:ABC-F family ATP-binding cassette domain-containing protein [Mogibacterium sp.]